jgi:hypothetical protein
MVEGGRCAGWLWLRNLKIENAGEKKCEEICCITNRDFRVCRIGSGKDQLLAQLRTLPRLHRRHSQKDVRMPQPI